MVERIHMIVGREEKERFRLSAARAGKSLSEWLREAAEEKLRASAAAGRLESAGALCAFFKECDERERGREPDWDAHLEIIERSIRTGEAET